MFEALLFQLQRRHRFSEGGLLPFLASPTVTHYRQNLCHGLGMGCHVTVDVVSFEPITNHQSHDLSGCKFSRYDMFVS